MAISTLRPRYTDHVPPPPLAVAFSAIIKTLKKQQQQSTWGDIELVAYLTDAAGTLPLVTDLRLAHDRHGSSSQPQLNGQLRYPDPSQVDRVLEEGEKEKILLS